MKSLLKNPYIDLYVIIFSLVVLFFCKLIFLEGSPRGIMWEGFIYSIYWLLIIGFFLLCRLFFSNYKKKVIYLIFSLIFIFPLSGWFIYITHYNTILNSDIGWKSTIGYLLGTAFFLYIYIDEIKEIQKKEAI